MLWELLRLVKIIQNNSIIYYKYLLPPVFATISAVAWSYDQQRIKKLRKTLLGQMFQQLNSSEMVLYFYLYQFMNYTEKIL